METRSGPFHILYQDDDLVAIDKPAGFLVHPPENPQFRVPRNRIVLAQLRAQIGRFVYPIHRLDVPTSGVLIWGLHQEAASHFNKLFRNQEITKHYHAVVRGWTPPHFTIDRDLENEVGDRVVSALTEFELIKQIELDHPVGKRYPTARYSWIKAHPRTGRYHQIRRHLNGAAHPIIGDHDHGDSHHNRFFRDQLGLSGLCLRAVLLEFVHPRSGVLTTIRAGQNQKWKHLQELFDGKINVNPAEQLKPDAPADAALTYVPPSAESP